MTDQRTREALRALDDAAEMLWVVMANVSGGDWKQQSEEWQEAAARWRDNYFAALKESREAMALLASPAVRGRRHENDSTE